ncbi:MAG: pseudouridine-5'-phosphate glycosidase [Firmicutes bacterium]|jgi:pseudouridine-5'-phosphate glycosidase|nr:pseudouridine-5'-phosphate glycosidase [Bacillota bacterium]
MLEKYLDIHPEVKEALESGKPVVALESTIISHGMPYPQNVETARNVEQIVRDNGAVPATIGIIEGRIKVGLTEEELEFMGKEKNIIKASRRDLPVIVSKGLNGATTVASTMICANMAGIRVFVTGGIGGVHRGAQETFDISADLMELASTNVAVICAGAKSILDIGLTLEYLETHGVPVLGYQTEDFPAFYTRTSGYKVDYKMDSPLEVASALKSKWDMDLKGGVVIGNPIPEEYAMDEKIITDAIEDAVKEAAETGIKGKESTPFLLGKIKEITKGTSLDSNIQLVYNNAVVGTKIAVEFAKL